MSAPVAPPVSISLPSIQVPGWQAAPKVSASLDAAPFAPPAPSVPAALSAERQALYQSLSTALEAAPEDLGGERAKGLADAFFHAFPAPAVPAADAVLGQLAPAEPADLSPAASVRPRSEAGAAAPRRKPFQPRSGILAGLTDHYRHARLLARHFYWYTVTHIKDLWPAYQRKLAALSARGEAPAVGSPRAFFTHMRVMGESGVFYVLGFSALNDREVLEESRMAFDRFFDGPGIGAAERLAFKGFLERVAVFNAAHRAHSNMKKQIRDALLAASVMPAGAVAPFFDSLAVRDKSAEIEAFQREGAAVVLAEYRRVVLETLAEEPDSPDAVLAVVLMGSFARGAATPTSDLDTELIVPDGREGRAEAFNTRLVARWEALGRQRANPITPHEHPLDASRRLLSMVHVDGAYRVLSLDEGLAVALAPRAEDLPAGGRVRHRTLRGRLGRLLEYALVYAVTLWTDWRGAASPEPGNIV
jgi:predicted nucleotidyltransferase